MKESICFLKDGKCSNCGECCSNLLPLTLQEKQRIIKIIKKRNLKPVCHFKAPLNVNYDMVCPLLGTDKKCLIYKDRPQICKTYSCGKSIKNGGMEYYNTGSAIQAVITNMRTLFER